MKPVISQQVKLRLDYQLELSNVMRRVEQRHMVDWILESVKKSITAKQEEEALKGRRSDKPINEIISCMDIRHCRDMHVSQLRWHPQMQKLNAVRDE